MGTRSGGPGPRATRITTTTIAWMNWPLRPRATGSRLPPVFGKDNVRGRILKQRPDFVFCKACDAAADFGQQKCFFGVLARGSKEPVAAGLERCPRDFAEIGGERGERVALAGETFPDAFLRAEFIFG